MIICQEKHLVFLRDRCNFEEILSHGTSVFVTFDVRNQECVYYILDSRIYLVTPSITHCYFESATHDSKNDFTVARSSDQLVSGHSGLKSINWRIERQESYEGEYRGPNHSHCLVCLARSLGS